MSQINKIISENMNNRFNIENEENLPFPGGMDLFFYGYEKNISVYLHIIFCQSASIKWRESGKYVYDKILVINTDLAINEEKLRENFQPVIDDEIILEFRKIHTYELSELDKVLSQEKNTFIIVLNTEKYLSSVHNEQLIKKLDGKTTTDIELKYLNVVDVVLNFKDKADTNFILFDTQLYGLELDFMDILNNIEELSICCVQNKYLEQEMEINNKIKKMIENKKVHEVLDYMESLEGVDNKDFLRLQVYSQLNGKQGYFLKEIDRLFERMDTNDLSMEENLKLAEISKNIFYSKQTILKFLSKALNLTNEYYYLSRIADVSENIDNTFHEEVINKVSKLFPNSEKVREHKLNLLINNNDFEQAYNLAIAYDATSDLISYLKFLKENHHQLESNYYSFFSLCIQEGFSDKYEVLILRMTRESLLNKKAYPDYLWLLISSNSIFSLDVIYNEHIHLAKIMLSKCNAFEENDDDSNTLKKTLEYLFDLTNLSDKSTTYAKGRLVELIQYSHNYGHGFKIIINYIYNQFVFGNFELSALNKIYKNSISTVKKELFEAIHKVSNEINLGTNLIVGEYHEFDEETLPNQKITDDLVRFFLYQYLDELDNEIDLESFNYTFSIVFNLSRYSSFKDSDFQFLSFSLPKMVSRINSQKIRDYLQYLLFLPKTISRKKLGLLGYADVSHRMGDKDEALSCLALSISDGKIPVDSYCTMGMLIVKTFRDLRFYDEALEVLGVLNSNIKDFDEKLYELMKNEITFLRLSIEFKQLLQKSDTDGLINLMDEIVQFYQNEDELGKDTNPPIILGVQVYNFLKFKGHSSIEFDKFISNIKLQNNRMTDLLSVMINDNFDAIFSLYLKNEASYAENLTNDMTNLKTLSHSYLNNLEDKEDKNLLFCLELLSEHSIKDCYSHKNDAQIPLFEDVDKFMNRIDSLRVDNDIIYLCLNQFNQLIVAHITQNNIDIKIEDSFSINKFHEWTKEFPREYGFYDMNDNPNLFFDSIESLGIDIKTTRHTIVIFDTQLHSLVPNILLQDGQFIGSENPISTIPSISWLNNLMSNEEVVNHNSELKSWISNDSSQGSTLETIIDRYTGENIFETYNIQLDTSHFLPTNLDGNKLLMITAHGGTTKNSNYFSTITDEGSLELHYQDFAKKLKNCGLVILFVCNAGRFNKHPYLSTTISLQKELLKNGCETVIASPWPLEAMMTPRWFEYFLNKWINESLTVADAVYQTNSHFFQGDNNPAKYLALNVFGNPFYKY